MSIITPKMRLNHENFLIVLALIFLFSKFINAEGNNKFRVDYERNIFLKDEQPFRECSGEMHYFRVPHQYWYDRLVKLKQMGLNTVQTYIEWAFHEPKEGFYRFDGDRDFIKFFEIARALNISVFLRPGPFINAERDLGGLPSWILGKTNKTRETDPVYQDAVARWFGKLLPMIKPYLYATGSGPILTVQIENEYGFEEICDHSYLMWLRDLVRRYLGDEVVLYTTDNSIDSKLDCGIVDGVFSTVDFGPGINPSVPFSRQRAVRPKGPLVNSEYYTGWLDYWTFEHQKRPANYIAENLARILDYLNETVHVSLYMFHGGTSFGMANGGSIENDTFFGQTTTYDYDAPLNEAGDPTEKYFALQKVIFERCRGIPVPPGQVPAISPKMGTGPIKLTPFLDLYGFMAHQGVKRISSIEPMTFENSGVSHGYLLYSTKILFDTPTSSVLDINPLEDRATIYIDKVYQGTLSKTEKTFSLKINARRGSQLDILVENQGRLSNGPMINDHKGILGDVKLDGQVLRNWNHAFVENWEDIFEDSSSLRDTLMNKEIQHDVSLPTSVPTFMRAIFVFPANSPIYDTFFMPSNLVKGVVYLNGRCLGRYWPKTGPQITLYTPGVWLRPYPQKNEIIVFESDPSPCVTTNDCEIQFVLEHNIDGPTPRRIKN
ncbi:beta-galactosidase-like [Brevipalpus obovatus]|uniref:beta-galactosidase-like n=1 Tax=Brevipalpus obovatus TaxID=246614 RepID=UPI003D9DDA58